VAYRGVTAGFPTGLCEIYLLRAIHQGVVVVVVCEQAALKRREGVARFPASLLIPLGRESLVEIES